MSSDLTTFAFAMKKRYDKVGKLENLTLADRPLMAMLAKDEDFSGEDARYPLIHGNPQGVAVDLPTAQANKSQIKGKYFSLTTGDYSGTVDVGDKIMSLSRNNMGAFLKNKAAESDALIEEMSDGIAHSIYSDGGNARGVVASTYTTGNTIPLEEKADAMMFEEGMVLVASDDDGSDASHVLRDSGDTVEVTAVDRENGTITVDNASLISGLAAGDYLFREGEFYGTTGNVLLKGLRAFIWVNNTPPALFGMTRTSDPTRLAGCRVPAADISASNIAERLQILGSRMTGRFKTPGPDKIFVNPENWTALSLSLQSNAYRMVEDTSTKFGFTALEGAIGGKMVRIYADRFCPMGVAFALKMSTWKLFSSEKLIHMVQGDGLSSLRASNSNDYELRFVSYPCLATNAPGYNGRVSLV